MYIVELNAHTRSSRTIYRQARKSNLPGAVYLIGVG